MATVTSITINHDGNPTSGPGDVIIGFRDEQVADLVAKLTGLGYSADAGAVLAHAEAIVDSHTIVAPGDPVPASAPAVAPEAQPAADPAGGAQTSTQPTVVAA